MAMDSDMLVLDSNECRYSEAGSPPRIDDLEPDTEQLDDIDIPDSKRTDCSQSNSNLITESTSNKQHGKCFSLDH